MRHLSVSRAWDETKAVLGRNVGLFVAVGLALFVLPQTVVGLVTPSVPEGEMPQAGAWMGLALIGLLVGLVGQLAVVRLALPPSTRVADAIRRGIRRAPAYLAASLLYALPLSLLVVLVAQPLMQSPGSPPPGSLLALSVLLVLLLPLIVRLLLTSAVATAEEGGPIQILRRSFDLTRGQTLRLLGVILLFLLVIGIVVAAAELAIGSVIALVAGKPEPLSMAHLVGLLLTNSVQTAVAVLFVVLLARIYVQLAAPDDVTVPRSGI